MFALRDIAHDLRQPLSTIEAIAYYLSLVLPHDDEKTHEQLERLQLLVEQSNWILSNGLALADPPAGDRSTSPVDLEELITQNLSARPAPSVHLEYSGNLPQVQADPTLARALIENLLTLCRQLATPEMPVVIHTAIHSPGVLVEIRTQAPGLRSIAGASLCVECARHIAEAHGGRVEVSSEAGMRLQLVLP